MDTMSYIIGRNSAGGGGTGSTPSWSDVTNKPFNTIGSGLEVDNGALIFDERELGDYVKTNDLAAVATSGDYDDLSNKPTIPQPTSVSVTQGLTTGVTVGSIDVDGVTTTLYAPAGGSVDIDNKSIIENGDGELQEAVPLYKEVASETDEGLYFDTFNYPAGNDLDTVLNTSGTHITLDTSNDAYTVTAVIDGVMYTGNWTASPSISSYEYGGSGKWKVTSPVTGNYELYWQWQNNTQYKIHIYMGGQFISTSNVSGLVFIPNNSGDTLLSQLEALQLDSYIGTAKLYNYHKLPNEYLNVATKSAITDSNYQYLLYENDNLLKTKLLTAGEGISLNTSNISNQGVVEPFISIASKIKQSPVGGYVNKEQGSTTLYMSNFEGITGTPFKIRYYTSQSSWNSFFNNAGSDKDLIFTLIYCTASSYYSNGPQMTGCIHLGATNTDQPVIEGFEEIIDSYYIDTTNPTKYFCIELKDGYNIGFSQYITMYRPSIYYPLKQNVNSFYLPLDNSTIVRDTTNGNIKTAIPAPPTTAGTYTLQVVVDASGNPTYSWI